MKYFTLTPEIRYWFSVLTGKENILFINNEKQENQSAKEKDR